MFSLIITIISIALVAALALATLYYGGGAFNKGSADAEAAKIMNQGQQLLGAADMYYADKGKWPLNINVLTDNNGEYLKSVPVAAAAISTAAAAGVAWDTPVPDKPVFVVPVSGGQEVCGAVNLKGSLAKRAILKNAFPELNAQCFGEGTSANPYRVVFKKFGTSDSLAGSIKATLLNSATDGSGDVDSSGVPTADNDPRWSAAPGTLGSGDGGGGGGGGGMFACVGDGGPLYGGQLEAWVGVQAAGADSVFASPTVTVDGTPVSLIATDPWTDEMWLSFDASSVTGGEHAIVLTGTGGKTASCSLTFTQDYTSGSVSAIELPVATGDVAGGDLVTVTATSGVFKVNDGHKPSVTVQGNNTVVVPDSQVTVVDAQTLKFTMPSAADLGLTHSYESAAVLVSNYGSSYQGVGYYAFANFPGVFGFRDNSWNIVTSYDMGAMSGGGTYGQPNLVLVNYGEAPLSLTGVSMALVGSAPGWEVDGPYCTPVVPGQLAPEETCYFNIGFNPSVAPGHSEAQVRLLPNGPTVTFTAN